MHVVIFLLIFSKLDAFSVYCLGNRHVAGFEISYSIMCHIHVYMSCKFLKVVMHGKLNDSIKQAH